jgi:hypothetical protein
MPRDGATGPTSSRNVRGRRGMAGGRKKIVIRPYQKPPSLPANYYQDTVQGLLRGTLDVLQTDESSSSQQQQKQQQSTPASISLQNAYTAVIHLVSHQFGPRLYRDLLQSLQEAARLVLSESSFLTGTALLRRLPQMYERYTHYLLCVQHVFLPLDRTHLWLPETQDVLVLRAAATGGVETNTTPSTGATTTATGGGPPVLPPMTPPPVPQQQDQQTIWQVGLAVFGQRLQELGWDSRLYEEWLRALLLDWNPTDQLPAKLMALQCPVQDDPLGRRQDLQAVWYLWQDLGWWTRLPLPQDLEDYWRSVSQRWTESSASTLHVAAKLIEFLYEKHQHVQQWPWLPTGWLHGIVEHCLLEPHLRESVDDKSNDAAQQKRATGLSFVVKTSLPMETGSVPILLLRPDYWDPILKAAVVGSSSNNSSSNLNNPATRTIWQLWSLAGRLPGGQARVARAIAQFAKREGISCLSTATAAGAPAKSDSSSNNFIADLLQLQLSLGRLLAALPHATEVVPLKSVWEGVLNTQPAGDQTSVAEALAKFLDQILRSNKKMDQYQRESDQWLQRIIAGVFVPLQAKDIFEAFYKKDLAKRLLWNRYVSMDVEKQVCSWLKAECGAAYTSKMEGMFQDMDFSRETMTVYKQSAAGGHAMASSLAGSVEMDVQVLTTGYWPVYPQYPNLNLPDSFKQPQDHFSNHYKAKYQGRRMTWQYALGHCVVRCSGFPKTYDLVVSLCQALVLTQFSSSTRLTIKQLMNAVGLEDRDEMERILQSLSMGKEGTRVLRKLDHDAEPQKKRKIRMNVDDRDGFEINANFESNQRRIRIQNIMVKETKEDRDQTVEAVSRDRLYLIDAVLVRIMKARKTILHQALIPQVMEQVKVPALLADVKQRIESLIEREYMERDAKDRSRYNYLA